MNNNLKQILRKSIKNIQDGFIKFHGCGVYRRDGTNVLYTKKRPCSNPINACFSMRSKDVTKKVRTRERELNERVYTSQSLKIHYQNELKKNHESYSTDTNTDTDDTDSIESDKLIIDTSK